MSTASRSSTSWSVTRFFWYATTCSVTDTIPNDSVTPQRVPLVAHLLDPGLGLLLRLRVPVAVERPHRGAVLGQVELLHLVGRAHVQVDRARVHRRDARAPSRRCRSPRRRPSRRSRPSRATPTGARSAPPGSPGRAAGTSRRARAARPAGRAGARAPPSAGRRSSRVLGRERQLVRGRGEVGQVDLLGLVVEDRPLDRPLEELVGVAAEELVERVVARHVHREAGAAAAGAAPHLAQRRDRAGERHADRRVEVADVDAELERVGGHDRQQVALGQPPLDLAPLRRRVAGAVGRDPLGEVARGPRPRAAGA